MASSAASIAGNTRPISGMLGIGEPACALAMVAAMFGSFDSSRKYALLAGVPSGTSAETVFRLSTLSRWFSMNSRAMSFCLEGAVIMQPSTPTKGLAGLPPTDGIAATPKSIFAFLTLSQAQGPLIIIATLPAANCDSMSE